MRGTGGAWSPGWGWGSPSVRLALYPPFRSSRVWVVGLSNCISSDPGGGGLRHSVAPGMAALPWYSSHLVSWSKTGEGRRLG